jgi:hypothetical protein
MLESLHEFCEVHPLPASTPSAIAITNKYGFRQLVEAIAKFYVLNLVDKMRTIWIYGAANSGKSTVIKFLRQIFLAQTMLLLEGKFTIVSAEHPFATQLILMDEASSGLFVKTNMELAKSFLEGRGYPHRAMNQTPYPDWEGACVLLATNGLPGISNPEHEDHSDNWLPVTYRTTFIKMTESHKGETKFPFDATVLAHAIMETIATHHPPSMTQCSQIQSQHVHEEEKRHLPNVPDFSNDDPVLAGLIGYSDFDRELREAAIPTTPVAVG